MVDSYDLDDGSVWIDEGDEMGKALRVVSGFQLIVLVPSTLTQDTVVVVSWGQNRIIEPKLSRAHLWVRPQFLSNVLWVAFASQIELSS